MREALAWLLQHQDAVTRLDPGWNPERAHPVCEEPMNTIDPELIERNHERHSVPKVCIQALVDRTEVDDRAIRSTGDKAALEPLVSGGASAAGVRSSVREWRASWNRTTNTYVIEITI
jgi:hypothetical protein